MHTRYRDNRQCCDQPHLRSGVSDDGTGGIHCIRCGVRLRTYYPAWRAHEVVERFDRSTARQWSEGIGPLVRVREYRSGY